MYKLGEASRARYKTLHPALKVLVSALLVRMDVTIVDGHRDEETQNRYYRTGKSGLVWPNSKHNTWPSLAVDLAPYLTGKGVRWDRAEVSRMYGRIEEIASSLGIPIRWGGDWDGDGDIVEHSLQDLVHVEIDPEKLEKTPWAYL